MSLRENHPRLVAAVFVAVLSILPNTVQSQSWRRATGRVQPIKAPPVMERLTAADANRADAFGWSVSISGDTLAVGAIQVDDAGTQNAGAVYVSTRTGGTWTQLQVIPNPIPGRNIYFGQVVLLVDDELFVGVPEDTISEVSRAGSVYAYTRDGDTFIQTQRLTMPEPLESARFGSSLASDGQNLVVGIPRGGESHEGLAYVFGRSGDLWELVQTLLPSDWIAGNNFGVAVAISGDWLVIGANGDPHDAIWGAGSAYVFRRSGDSWVEHQKLTADEDDLYDGFGYPIAISGDSVVIGAGGKDYTNPNPDNNQENAGSVYVFTEDNGTWTQQAQLFSQNPEDGTGWGGALALSGDTAFVGFPAVENSGFLYAGCADVLARTGDTWSHVERVFSPEPVNSGGFGYAISVSGSDLLIGAPMEDAPENVWDAGAVYVMPLPGPSTKITAREDGPSQYRER